MPHEVKWMFALGLGGTLLCTLLYPEWLTRDPKIIWAPLLLLVAGAYALGRAARDGT